MQTKYPACVAEQHSARLMLRCSAVSAKSAPVCLTGHLMSSMQALGTSLMVRRSDPASQHNNSTQWKLRRVSWCASAVLTAADRCRSLTADFHIIRVMRTMCNAVVHAHVGCAAQQCSASASNFGMRSIAASVSRPTFRSAPLCQACGTVLARQCTHCSAKCSGNCSSAMVTAQVQLPGLYMHRLDA